METLSNGYTLQLCPGAFPLSTDSMVLQDFVRMGSHAQVLDLGSGCGTLGLLLCAASDSCTVTGIELRQEDHLAALKNSRRNGLTHRLKSICADLRSMPEALGSGSFDICVSNPPYFSGGEVSKKAPFARRNDLCPPEALFAAAAQSLKFGGDFYLVHKPEQLAQLMHLGCRSGLEPKRLRLVRHRLGSPPALVLLQCRKGGRPGLVWEEMTLFATDGSPTGDYRRIYHT